MKEHGFSVLSVANGEANTMTEGKKEMKHSANYISLKNVLLQRHFASFMQLNSSFTFQTS